MAVSSLEITDSLVKLSNSNLFAIKQCTKYRTMNGIKVDAKSGLLLNRCMN